MKQIKLFLFLLFSFVSCQKQAESNIIVSKAKAVVNIDKVKFETVGFSDKYDLLPKLNFQEIGEKEFNELKNSTNLLTKKSVKENLKNYYLETDNNVLELKKENKRTIGNRNGEVWYEYLGFYSSLDMYAFSTNSVSESLGFSDFELINKSNGKIYKIVSPGDGKIESPVPSSQTKYLAYFYNQVYNDNNSFLGILKIDSNKNLEEFASFISEDFKIYQITWSKADVILIKVSSDNGKNFKYFKSDIPSKKY